MPIDGGLRRSTAVTRLALNHTGVGSSSPSVASDCSPASLLLTGGFLVRIQAEEPTRIRELVSPACLPCRAAARVARREQDRIQAEEPIFQRFTGYDLFARSSRCPFSSP